ncbi:MAG: hypothetical protein J6W75_09685 [Bacteroidaceae bacterium]|nr:hypothetical protein [Bacteroidaceae bacterium]
MKKPITFSLCYLFALSAFAQQPVGDSRLKNIDWSEDSTKIVSVEDIIDTQCELTSRNLTSSHYTNVWKRNKYFNLGYVLNNSELSPKEDIPTGADYNNGFVPGKYSSNWGISMQRGTNIPFVKKPIANTLRINFDIMPFDLHVAHFTRENDGRDIYNSAVIKETANKDNNYKGYKYIPWNLEKYKLDYGIRLGLSLTVTPFNYIHSAPGLHHLKFNTYFHAGYRLSMLIITGKHIEDGQEVKESAELNWGHGLTTNWGIVASWKGIGFGYERTGGPLQYKPILTNDYSGASYKFKAISNRIYLQFLW